MIFIYFISILLNEFENTFGTIKEIELQKNIILTITINSDVFKMMFLRFRFIRINKNLNRD